MEENNFTSTVDPETGTQTVTGDLRIEKGNHKHMPKRTHAYQPTDERGHIQASSRGGGNGTDNVVPQARDLNHGAYYNMEMGEGDALKSGAQIHSEKIAYTTDGPGSRPSAFMVNDTITYPDGKTEQVHHSFANLSNKEQESYNQALMDHTDMLGKPDLGKNGANMSAKEYAALMEETEADMPNIRDEYQPTSRTYVPNKKPKEQPKEVPKGKEEPEIPDSSGEKKSGKKPSRRTEPEQVEQSQPSGTKTAAKQKESDAAAANKTSQQTQSNNQQPKNTNSGKSQNDENGIGR